MDVVALLLAAGESERMGAPKALVEWHGLPLLSRQLQQIQKSRVRECVVVLGREPGRLEPLVSPSFWPGWKARPVYNPRHEEGKCSSVVAGLNALAAPPDGVLIVAVDQPVSHRVLNALIGAAEEEWEKCAAAGRRRILVPVFHDRRGHPPLFCMTLISELMGISEESEGLRAVMRRDPARVLQVPTDDAGVLLNINTPVDLAAGRFQTGTMPRHG
ncbi:MAG: nucleotidyltransferase family protein [Candidatus Polarisedimenticolia bacterium]